MLDPTFGTGGILQVGIIDATSLVLQPDGKLVVAGYMAPVDFHEGMLARYLPNGTLDPTFGTDGKVRTSVGGPFGAPSVLIVQPDGKLVVGGGTGSTSLARFLPNGTLDPTFGTGGEVVTGIYDGSTNAMMLQQDGRLVVAGTGGQNTAQGFVLARFLPNGVLDPSFGTGGKVTTDLGNLETANALVIQPDGKLVVAGATGPLQAQDFALVRYLPNGTLDPGFESGGRVITDSGGEDNVATSLIVQADGNLVAAGYGGPSTNQDFVLSRYLPSGALDHRFGADGLRSVGGRGLSITPRTSIDLTWSGGEQQLAYLVARWPAAIAVLPNRATTSYSDRAPAYDRNLNCYAVSPLDANGPLASSDLLCAQLGLRSPNGVPQDFTLRLNQSMTAALSWSATSGHLGYLLLSVPFDFNPPRVVGLPSEARGATDAIGETFTCYQLYAMYPVGLAQTDLVCGLPGASTFPLAEAAAPATPELPARTAAAKEKLDRLLQDGRAKVEQEAGKLRQGGRPAGR
jgi:uncharacterized delta-60 repeat protein